MGAITREPGIRTRPEGVDSLSESAACIAERMIRDAEKLRSADPELFLEVLKEISPDGERATAGVTKGRPSRAGIFKDDPFAEQMILPDGVYLIEDDTKGDD